jgi:hypothetical protein
MNGKKIRHTLLLILLIINVVSTSLHYTDNFLNNDKYPEPAWITPNGVYISWIVLTLFGVAGYLLYVKNAFWIAYLCLGIYSITGISSTAHYFFPATEPFSLKMNVLIWFDAIAGTSLLIFTLWSALLLQEWQKKYEV